MVGRGILKRTGLFGFKKSWKNGLLNFFQTPIDWEEIKKHCSKLETFLDIAS